MTITKMYGGDIHHDQDDYNYCLFVWLEKNGNVLTTISILFKKVKITTMIFKFLHYNFIIKSKNLFLDCV